MRFRQDYLFVEEKEGRGCLVWQSRSLFSHGFLNWSNLKPETFKNGCFVIDHFSDFMFTHPQHCYAHFCTYTHTDQWNTDQFVLISFLFSIHISLSRLSSPESISRLRSRHDWLWYSYVGTKFASNSAFQTSVVSIIYMILFLLTKIIQPWSVIHLIPLYTRIYTLFTWLMECKFLNHFRILSVVCLSIDFNFSVDLTLSPSKTVYQ